MFRKIGRCVRKDNRSRSQLYLLHERLWLGRHSATLNQRPEVRRRARTRTFALDRPGRRRTARRGPRWETASHKENRADGLHKHEMPREEREVVEVDQAWVLEGGVGVNADELCARRTRAVESV